MPSIIPRAALLLPIAFSVLGAQRSVDDARAARVVELTIAQAHAEMRAGRLTCRALVQAYLDRIAAYDKRGPAINAIVGVNPDALAIADSLDRVMRARGALGPLHCVPMVVKENMETREMPTTAGSLALQGMRTGKDATIVRRVREAGAVILAKTNMAELAFSPYETVSSILPGYTRNPYELDRVTAGSSGGTAAAVAASFALAGLGTDTGNSIRGPSSHQALVGIRSTMGLTSRAGIVPLNLGADIAGPMARTVADAAAVFQVVVGEDPADSVTAHAREHPAPDYAASLRADGLRGARIGVLHQAYDTPTTDAEIRQRFATALADLRRAGATVIDSVRVDSLDAWLRAPSGGVCNPFRWDLERYLAPLGDAAPVKSVDEILRSRRYHPSIQTRLEAARDAKLAPEENPACASREQFRAKLRAGVLALMDSLRLDALVYPTWSNVPRLIGDLNTPAGDNSQLFSPSTGFPALTVPMGYTRDGVLPAGLQIFGRPWSEATLIRLAYGYEQATHHRHAPATTPELAR
jgi:Asp-tRNA(Asn)/Glu-tRNA(Gln) amidotransferase A subunit family amidase